MEEIKIDARGLSCPQPVILTQKALKEGKGKIEVLVDTVVSKENVLRTAKKAKAEVTVIENREEYLLVITKN